MRIIDWSSDVCSSDLMHTIFHSGDRVATDVGSRCQIVLLPAQEMSGGPQDERHPASLVRHHVGRTETDTGTRCVCFRSELDAALLQCGLQRGDRCYPRSEEHTSELQSLMRISYAVFCLKTKQ